MGRGFGTRLPLHVWKDGIDKSSRCLGVQWRRGKAIIRQLCVDCWRCYSQISAGQSSLETKFLTSSSCGSDCSSNLAHDRTRCPSVIPRSIIPSNDRSHRPLPQQHQRQTRKLHFAPLPTETWKQQKEGTGTKEGKKHFQVPAAAYIYILFFVLHGASNIPCIRFI